jgi:hypothetical protein
MRRILLLLALLIGANIYAGDAVVTFKQFKKEVRYLSRIHSTVTLPDSVLQSACKQSVVSTSVECGGVESNYRLTTTANIHFYALPDTITQVLYGTLLTSKGFSFPLKAWYPQFSDLKDKVGRLESPTADESSPSMFNYWANTLQLIPPPIRTDTVYLKCFVEHRTPDTTTALDTLKFKSEVYVNAALLKATAKVLHEVGEDERAVVFETLYEKQAALCRTVYARGFDLQPSVKQ